MSLQPPDATGPNCFGNEGRAIHELMHAIGVFYEQSRADRDRFVKIHWDTNNQFNEKLNDRKLISSLYQADAFYFQIHRNIRNHRLFCLLLCGLCGYVFRNCDFIAV